MGIHEEWRAAYATQSFSDWATYELLGNASVCQRLHYLQMHLEKICKAYLWELSRTETVPAFHRNHNVIAKTMPMIFKQYWHQVGGKPNGNELDQIRELCREIDLLAPAVDDSKRRPDNCEYPWYESGRMHIPVQHEFRIYSRILNTTYGRNILKLSRYLCDLYRLR